jgi:hypothetical protein
LVKVFRSHRLQMALKMVLKMALKLALVTVIHFQNSQ